MRRLTFKGFLESYVRHLAGRNTLALGQIAVLARSEPRLVEPLLLWAATTGRASRLSEMLGGDVELKLELADLALLDEQGRLETVLSDPGSLLRPEYAKVWRSYVVRRDAGKRDAQLKLQARKRVLALEVQKGVSRYRMAKDLGLNPGNLHAFLSQANPSKVSLDHAYELVRYLEAA